MKPELCPKCAYPIFASIDSPGMDRHGQPIHVVFYRCLNGHTCSEPGLVAVPEDATIPRDWLDGYVRIYGDDNDVDNEGER